MRDDELRQELGSLLRPIREAAPPDLPVIRHRLTRLRRRRARSAGMSAVATVAAVAIGVVAVHAATGSAGSNRAAGAIATPDAASPVGNGYMSTTSYTVNSRITSLVVSGEVGSISVTGSQRATTSVTARLYYTTIPPTLIRSLSGSTLTLGYSCPIEVSCGVSFDVQVPRDAAVQAIDGAGGISLSGLAGKIDASDETGAISAANITSGSVTLWTDTGGISASLLAPPTALQANANVGAIDIGLPASDSYRVKTSTDIGGTNVSVPVDRSSKYSITATTGTGAISIVTGSVASAASDGWSGWSGLPIGS